MKKLIFLAFVFIFAALCNAEPTELFNSRITEGAENKMQWNAFQKTASQISGTKANVAMHELEKSNSYFSEIHVLVTDGATQCYLPMLWNIRTMSITHNDTEIRELPLTVFVERIAPDSRAAKIKKCEHKIFSDTVVSADVRKFSDGMKVTSKVDFLLKFIKDGETKSLNCGVEFISIDGRTIYTPDCKQSADVKIMKTAGMGFSS
ncbi:hypothetical protein AAIR98_001136 [Elusimicrobium simillimum]|uniref:hypothetical protein n=1 Tax=Elusimicrobium simillimum TaxID=3143438 RepID=UPI003C6FF488